MNFYADLHIHSKYSRATSRDCDLENLAFWGRKKGISVIGTGDFTHPAWIREIRDKLVPAEAGLFRLREDIEKEVTARLPPSCQNESRFMLSVEVSTIYKKGDKTRKVHHLIFAPSIEKAEVINRSLEKIGNIRSDGRPILGLDSRHLLEIVLQAGEDCFLVPAHIWTPWFSVLGSKSGFDTVAECYGDLAPHIFAVETGLSSDPLMNRRVSHLDRYRLISNSDAHSPAKLGREACLFTTNRDYYSMRRALETGEGYGGTVEFFPEEGKYHMDGHRNCGVRLCPEESRAHGGLCPVCRKPLTLGVMYRVMELADRSEDCHSHCRESFQNLIPLPEMISETLSVGPSSKAVVLDYEKMLHQLGTELSILGELPIEAIQKSSSSLIAEAIRRMREGRVIREAGYDGEYGRIRLFEDKELRSGVGAGVLFDVAEMPASRQRSPRQKENILPAAPPPFPPRSRGVENAEGLDPEQWEAVETLEGPLLITAGPGSGKTRVLTRRVAHLIQSGKAAPASCLTITFSRRAAAEIEERLETLLGAASKTIPVMTFHAFAHLLLQENREAAGIIRGFRLASDDERRRLLMSQLNISEKKAGQLLSAISRLKRGGENPGQDARVKEAASVLDTQRDTEGWLDFDDLLLIANRLLEEDAALRQACKDRYGWISVDEFQDVDEMQYRLLRHLAAPDGNLCVIGDPDQAIYGFRGSDVKFFLRFDEDFPGAKKIRLSRNYRSGETLVSASSQMIAPQSLVEDRSFEAFWENPGRLLIHAARSDKAEAEALVEHIERLVGGLSFFSMDSGRSEGQADKAYAFEDFAILYRTEAQSTPLVDALKRSGIPYRKHSHEPLSENPAVTEALEIFRKLPRERSLSDNLAQALGHTDPTFIPGQSLQNPALEKMREIGNLSMGDYNRFWSEIQLAREADAWDPRAAAVTLMTLHASKGLEFPVVFIPGCEDGILPLRWGHEDSAGETDAEERRLFYVGMTRARERLFLSWAQKRFWNGKLRVRIPSPFLRDIEEKLMEVIKSKAFRKNSPGNVQMDLL